MKKTIYPKLFAGYLLFGILGFTVISTITYHLSYRYTQDREASDLYKEANLIASDYASSYYGNTVTLTEFEERLEALSHYLSAQIWIIGANGDILVNSSQKADLSNIETIEGFNITVNNGLLYISYFTLAILILCAFVLLAIFTWTIILPIKKITKAA